jgi:hypothetical protein
MDCFQRGRNLVSGPAIGCNSGFQRDGGVQIVLWLPWAFDLRGCRLEAMQDESGRMPELRRMDFKETNDDARSAAARILEQSMIKKQRCYIYVNNRLEGSAPLTIAGFLPRNF